MGKSKKAIIAIIILIALLVPFRVIRIKDGGSVEYKALLYSVTKVHALTDQEDVFFFANTFCPKTIPQVECNPFPQLIE